MRPRQLAIGQGRFLSVYGLRWSRGMESQDLVHLTPSRSKPYEVNSR